VSRLRSDPIYTATLEAFAAKHRLTTVRGPDERYVKGRHGFITEFSPSRLHLILSPGTGNTGWWNNRRRIAVGHGMVIDQDGDTEGSLIFDPASPGQTRTAIRLSGARTRRAPTDAQLAALRRPGSRTPPSNSTKTTLKTTIAQV
jgi:hypothetical protein